MFFSPVLMIVSFNLQARSSSTSLHGSQYLLPCCLCPSMFFFWPLSTAVMTPGETPLGLSHEGVCVAIGYVSQDKARANGGFSQIIPSQTHHPHLCSEGSGLLFLWGNMYYFRLFVLNLSCLSMQCACEQWMIINVCLWSVYLSLAVKSAMHSIAWVKESKLWITGELNFNLYVKQRLRLKKKSNSFGRKMDMHFCSFIYSCSGMGTIFE